MDFEFSPEQQSFIAEVEAFLDAVGVKDIAMPATPERVWRAIQSKQA